MTWLLRGLAGLALLLGLVGVVGRASQRLLWNDELFSLYISQLPVGSIPRALADGLDLQPPLGYIATKAVTAVAGEGLVSVRLPSITGWLLASVGLAIFVGRRAGEDAGLVALFVPWITGAYDYAFEARPYALVLGAVALSLVAWQWADDRRYRRLALAGLPLVIASAVSLHYYAFLVVAALAAGELTRGRMSGHRPGVWLAMAAGLVPLALFIPLMRAASLYGERFWTAPALGHLPYSYRNLLYPTLLPASIFLVVGATAWAWRGAPSRLPTPARLRAAWVPDLVACVTLFLVPVFAVAISFGVGGFRDRYAIAMVLGFGGVIGLFFGLAGSPVMTRLAVAVLAIWVLARSLPAVVPLIAGAPPPDVLAVHPLLASNRLPPQGEIAIPNDAIYTQLAHYADPALRSRLRMLLPPSATPDRRLETSSERSMRALARWHPVALQEYADLLASKQPFLLYGETQWADDQLARDGIALTLLGGGNGGRALFLATP